MDRNGWIGFIDIIAIELLVLTSIFCGLALLANNGWAIALFIAIIVIVFTRDAIVHVLSNQKSKGTEG